MNKVTISQDDQNAKLLVSKYAQKDAEKNFSLTIKDANSSFSYKKEQWK